MRDTGLSRHISRDGSYMRRWPCIRPAVPLRNVQPPRSEDRRSWPHNSLSYATPGGILRAREARAEPCGVQIHPRSARYRKPPWQTREGSLRLQPGNGIHCILPPTVLAFPPLRQEEQPHQTKHLSMRTEMHRQSSTATRPPAYVQGHFSLHRAPLSLPEGRKPSLGHQGCTFRQPLWPAYHRCTVISVFPLCRHLPQI